ncbi:hypothetical protein SALBM311S_09974 [Streptomyces alboniger]
MSERKPRKDAARNRQAVLAAADALLAPTARARKASPWPTSRLRPASAKARRFFRAFGDRPGTLRALYEAPVGVHAAARRSDSRSGRHRYGREKSEVAHDVSLHDVLPLPGKVPIMARTSVLLP